MVSEVDWCLLDALHYSGGCLFFAASPETGKPTRARSVVAIWIPAAAVVVAAELPVRWLNLFALSSICSPCLLVVIEVIQ